MVSYWLSVHPSVHLSYIRPSLFLFPDNNLSECWWIFTKLGMSIGIVEIWFGITNGHISSVFDRVFYQQHVCIFSFQTIPQWIFTKLGMCIDIVEIWFEIANGQTFINF